MFEDWRGAAIGGTPSDWAGPIDDGDASDDDGGDAGEDDGGGATSEGGCAVARDGGRDVGDVSGDSGAGVVEHPATMTSARTDGRERTRGRNMEWILLEAAIAMVA